jgi:hypothetical protein
MIFYFWKRAERAPKEREGCGTHITAIIVTRKNGWTAMKRILNRPQGQCKLRDDPPIRSERAVIKAGVEDGPFGGDAVAVRLRDALDEPVQARGSEMVCDRSRGELARERSSWVRLSLTKRTYQIERNRIVSITATFAFPVLSFKKKRASR